MSGDGGDALPASVVVSDPRGGAAEDYARRAPGDREAQPRAARGGAAREARFVFQSRPYEAHIQFSNVCNMSCIMCYDGWIPPLRKMSPEILDRLTRQMAPVPLGRDPLRRQRAADRDLGPGARPRDASTASSCASRRTSSSSTSRSSRSEGHHGDALPLDRQPHPRAVREDQARRASPTRCSRTCRCAARLSQEHGVECLAQIVFMTENARAASGDDRLPRRRGHRERERAPAARRERPQRPPRPAAALLRRVRRVDQAAVHRDHEGEGHAADLERGRQRAPRLPAPRRCRRSCARTGITAGSSG